MKAYLIDTEKKEARVVEIDDWDTEDDMSIFAENEAYHKVLGCKQIEDIVTCRIGGRWFDIIVGKNKSSSISGYDRSGLPLFTGKILVRQSFTDENVEEGTIPSLSDKEIALIQEFIVKDESRIFIDDIDQ